MFETRGVGRLRVFENRGVGRLRVLGTRGVGRWLRVLGTRDATVLSMFATG